MTDDRPPQPDAPLAPEPPTPGSGSAGPGPTPDPTGASGPSAPPPPDPSAPPPPGAPSGPPPGDAFPGGGAAEPPPLTAFAWRNGLVRPRQGRLLAGVCGAFGRATNTDPVLWRVVIAVLTIFAGIGALIYLIAWLTLPADGDTASPVEALAGRGRSGTSTPLTVIGGVIVIFSLAAYVSEPFRATPLLAIVLLGGILLLLLRDQQRGRTKPWTSGQPAPSGAAPGYAPPSGPAAPMYAAGPPTATATMPGYAPQPPYGGPPYPPPPFAPHGPFAPQPPRPPIVRPPRPKPPRSRLGGLTLSLALLTVGALAVVNLLGYNVAPLAFFAAAIAVVGAGLLVGAWLGRARWLIAIGLVLTFLLGGGAVANHNWNADWWHQTGSNTWVPSSVDALQPAYRQGVGDATLDLSSVDFSNTVRPVDLAVSVHLGSLKVILPPNVDVVVTAIVNVGDARVFRETWDGLGQESRTITDLGADGAGGGQLHLNATVDVGDLEVSR